MEDWERQVMQAHQEQLARYKQAADSALAALQQAITHTDEAMKSLKAVMTQLTPPPQVPDAD